MCFSFILFAGITIYRFFSCGISSVDCIIMLGLRLYAMWCYYTFATLHRLFMCIHNSFCFGFSFFFLFIGNGNACMCWTRWKIIQNLSTSRKQTKKQKWIRRTMRKMNKNPGIHFWLDCYWCYFSSTLFIAFHSIFLPYVRTIFLLLSFLFISLNRTLSFSVFLNKHFIEFIAILFRVMSINNCIAISLCSKL